MPREGLEERRAAALALLRSGATSEAAEVLFENILRLMERSEYAWWLRLALARERRLERRRGGDRLTASGASARTRRQGKPHLSLRRPANRP
jgi:hypothetical protein